ncbi:MAG: epoxyqueuosine reductase QueH [Treponema sp.]|nr:epoxyqueuosine reductase QueH [Treponema sp.]
MKLLLHACCGPCSIQCIEALAEEGIRPALYWYNPNIHPFTEYRSRRDSLCAFAESRGLPLIVNDEYGLRPFIKAVENDGSHLRCVYCYRLRLEKAAAVAAAEGYDAFSATLLISPYQDHELLREAGEEFAARYKISFFYRDFRHLFHLGRNQAREAGYYMQKYCGCIYSEEERYRPAEGSDGSTESAQ